MDCETTREKLIEYVDGDLSVGERAAVDAHLGHCYLCQEEVDEIRAVLGACRRVLRHPAPTNGFAQLRERMATQTKPVAMAGLNAFRLRRLGYGLATAAALAMIFWSSAPSVRAARAFLAPLRANSAAFQEWVDSEESVAPVVAKMFIDRRIEIEETLGREGELVKPTEEPTAAEEAESSSMEPPGEEPVDELAPEAETNQDAHVWLGDAPREHVHA